MTQFRFDRKTEAYKKWRAAVVKRDNMKCQMPGCTNLRGRILHAHHIQRWADAPLLRYSVKNGITLCNKCHQKVNRNEQYYISLFVSIVQKNTKK